MARELGGSQISALLESVPGIVNVLRNPVADALVGMIRAGAGLDEFRLDYAKELVQYAERRGLINTAEAEQLLEEVTAVAPRKGKRATTGSRKTVLKAAKGKADARRAATKKAKKPPTKAKPPKKKTGTKKPVKKAVSRSKRR